MGIQKIQQTVPESVQIQENKLLEVTLELHGAPLGPKMDPVLTTTANWKKGLRKRSSEKVVGKHVGWKGRRKRLSGRNMLVGTGRHSTAIADKATRKPRMQLMTEH